VLVVGPDRKVQYRAVTLGPLVDGLRIVRSGLKPKDRVIVNGLQRVRPGAVVDPVVVAMDAPEPSQGGAPAQSTANEPAPDTTAAAGTKDGK
jgi:multidrug efflux system membrane fusion protein